MARPWPARTGTAKGKVTGLPAPTTGTTRSAKALLEGELANSLYYNPMTVPSMALVALALDLGAPSLGSVSNAGLDVEADESCQNVVSSGRGIKQGSAFK